MWERQLGRIIQSNTFCIGKYCFLWWSFWDLDSMSGVCIGTVLIFWYIEMGNIQVITLTCRNLRGFTRMWKWFPWTRYASANQLSTFFFLRISIHRLCVLISRRIVIIVYLHLRFQPFEISSGVTCFLLLPFLLFWLPMSRGCALVPDWSIILCWKELVLHFKAEDI